MQENSHNGSAKCTNTPTSVYTDYRPTPLQHYMFLGGRVFLVVDEKGQFQDDNFSKAMHALGDSAQEDAERKLGLHGGNAKGNNKKAKRMGKGLKET